MQDMKMTDQIVRREIAYAGRENTGHEVARPRMQDIACLRPERFINYILYCRPTVLYCT